MDAAALSELRDACAGAMRYAQEFNAYTDESEGQAALIIAWQCVVEVTFTRRCVLDTLLTMRQFLRRLPHQSCQCGVPVMHKVPSSVVLRHY